jgi:hypothetical protein
METDALLQCPFYLSSRVSNKGAFPPGSLHTAPMERVVPSPESLSVVPRDLLTTNSEQWV